MIDLSLLGIELAFGQSVWGNVLTGSILAVFMVDHTVLRVDTYRYLFFRSFFGWFDLTVVVGSTALFIVGLPCLRTSRHHSRFLSCGRFTRCEGGAWRCNRIARVSRRAGREHTRSCGRANPPTRHTHSPIGECQNAFGTRVRGRGGHLSRPRFGSCQNA